MRAISSLFCVVLFVPGTFARDGLEDYEVAAISGRIASIVTGGLWRRADINGEYRLVVTRYDYAENTTNEFFIQWLRTEHPWGREVVHHSARIYELNGYCISDGPRHLATDTPDDFGQSFELTANPRGIYNDKLFTITPHPDFTYSITSRRPHFSPPLVVSIAAALVGGVALGAFVTYAKVRTHNA